MRSFALAEHPQEPAALVDVVDVEADQLADPDRPWRRAARPAARSRSATARSSASSVRDRRRAGEVHPFGGHVEQLGGVALGEHGGKGPVARGAASRRPGPRE